MRNLWANKKTLAYPVEFAAVAEEIKMLTTDWRRIGQDMDARDPSIAAV